MHGQSPSARQNNVTAREQQHEQMIELFLLPTAKHSLQTLPAWEADVFECISWLATCPFRHMDVSLTIVTPAMAFDGRRETNTARRAFAAAWAQPVDVTVLVPQDVGVAPWSLVHLREQRQASNSFAAHATAVNVHSTAVLLDVGDFSSIDCTFADWAFLAVEELQGHRGLAGATLAPAAALHRNVPSTVPFSRAFAHAHPGAGGYLPAPRVWNAFVQWAANGRGDDASSSRRAHSEGPRALLKALQQRLQAAAQVQGLVDDSVGVAFSQWAWSLHFPHLEELTAAHVETGGSFPLNPWQAWFAAFCSQEHLATYYLPGSVHLLALPALWGPSHPSTSEDLGQDVGAGITSHHDPVAQDLLLAANHQRGDKQGQQNSYQLNEQQPGQEQQQQEQEPPPPQLAALNRHVRVRSLAPAVHYRSEPFGAVPHSLTDKHLFPDELQFFDWDNSAVPTCASSPCAHGQVCMNHAQGYVCCTPGTAACREKRAVSSTMLRVLVPVGVTSPTELQATLSDLAASVEALQLLERNAGANSDADVDGDSRRVHSAAVAGPAGAALVERSSLHGASIPLDIVLVTDAGAGADEGGTHGHGTTTRADLTSVTDSRALLKVVDGFAWPFGRRGVRHLHSREPLSRESVLHSTSAVASLVLELTAPPSSATPGGTSSHVLLVDTAERTVASYSVAWARAVVSAYAPLAAVGGLTLSPLPQSSVVARDAGEGEGGGSAGIGAVLHADVGAGSHLLFARHRRRFEQFAAGAGRGALMDSGRLHASKRSGHAHAGALEPIQLVAAFYSAFATQANLFFARPIVPEAAGLGDSGSSNEFAIRLPASTSLQAINFGGRRTAVCLSTQCPVHHTCEDRAEGAVCICTDAAACRRKAEREKQQEEQEEQQEQQKQQQAQEQQDQQQQQQRAQEQEQKQEQEQEQQQQGQQGGPFPGNEVEWEDEAQADAIEWADDDHDDDEKNNSHDGDGQTGGSEGRTAAGDPRHFHDEAALRRVLEQNKMDGGAGGASVILLSASSGFVDFFFNWLESARRVGVRKYVVIAEDIKCYRALEAKDPGHALLSSVRLVEAEGDERSAGPEAEDTAGFAYASKEYNELVGRRPSYIASILRLGYSVLYSDTDTVWLEDPTKHFPAGYDMYIQSDKEGGSSTVPTCTSECVLLCPVWSG